MKLPKTYTLHSFDTLDSTNAKARELAAASAGNAIIWVKAQTAGRGRYDRAWVSEAGNLFVTFLLFPEAEATRLPELSFVAALAVRDAIGAGAFKWPNDVLLNGKKVSGILLEGGRNFVAAGIGINIASHPDSTLYPATSLAAEGIATTVEKLLEKLAASFDSCYRNWHMKGFASIRTAWLAHAANLGEIIEVRLADRSLKGIFKGLTPEGALELELPDGRVEIINAGDVFLF